MRIGIEAQRIFRSNKHGMDYVVLEEVRELQKIDFENEYYIFVSPGDDRCLSETKNFKIVEITTPSYPLWEQIGLPRAVKKYNIELLHCTSNTAPIFCNVPLILTLHDIIFLEPKQEKNKSLYQNLGRIYRRLVVPKILDKCKKIITVSEFERDRIKSSLGLPDDKIISIYNGFGSHFRVINDCKKIRNKYIKDKNYIFFLGNTDPKKNLRGTLVAYSRYLEQSKEKLPLLLGDLKEEYLDWILKDAGIVSIKPKLRLSGYISNADLPFIYNDSTMFLYTSFRESFGIPLLEAMASGTPVITGNASALPEIAGEDAILVDVANSDEIVNAMLRLETDADYYTTQVNYGLNRVKLFSWENTARNLYNLYSDFRDGKI